MWWSFLKLRNKFSGSWDVLKELGTAFVAEMEDILMTALRAPTASLSMFRDWILFLSIT
jgi:hypothetical protein